MAIQIGQQAPSFEVDAVVGKKFEKVKLSDYKGKWVVLFFYPLDFTFVCPTEIQEFSKRNAEFDKLGVQVLGASIDSKFSHLAWVENGLGELKYPLLADLTKQISRAYDVLDEESGIAFRGTYIIDPNGVLRYALKHDNSVGRSVEEVLRNVQAIQYTEKNPDQVCPVEWKPGAATLTPG
jgi:peroxiredoxin 2/4